MLPGTLLREHLGQKVLARIVAHDAKLWEAVLVLKPRTLTRDIHLEDIFFWKINNFHPPYRDYHGNLGKIIEE